MQRLFSHFMFDGFSNKLSKSIYSDCLKTLHQNSLSEGLLKIIIVPIGESWEDVEYYIFPRELPKIILEPVRIIFYSEKKYPILRFNPMYKSLSYMGNILAMKDAKQEGAFEPIFYNQFNIITEGAMRNIFFIKDKVILTPSLDLGILNGVTRENIIKLSQDLGYSINYSNIQISDINSMDEAFITSTGIGLTPCYWDGWKSNYTITLELKNIYNQMIKME